MKIPIPESLDFQPFDMRDTNLHNRQLVRKSIQYLREKRKRLTEISDPDLMHIHIQFALDAEMTVAVRFKYRKVVR